MIIGGSLALIYFVSRDRRAEQGRIMPLEATRFSHPIANGLATTFLLSICIMSFLVYGPFLLIELYDMSPLEAGFIVLIESLAWGSAAVMMSGIRAELEPRLIRVGSAMVVFGLVAIGLSLSNDRCFAVIRSTVMSCSPSVTVTVLFW